MFIHWNSEFDSAQIAWLLFSAIALLATLLPATGITLARGRYRDACVVSAESWFTGLLLHVGVWFLLYQSLTFGPSLGTTPAEAEDSGPPQPMESMIQEAASIVDQRHLHGRGGFIGDLSLSVFKNLDAQGNPEEPLFASRRPHHSVPLMSYFIVQLAVYLSAVTAVTFAAFRHQWHIGRMLLFGLLWGGLVYAPAIHWLWGDGWLLLRGAIDSGGASFLIVVATSVAVMGYQKRGQVSPNAGAIPEDEVVSHRVFVVSASLMIIGMIVLMTSLTVPPFTVKGLGGCNAFVAAFGGLAVSLVIRAVQRAGEVTVSPVESSLFGLAAVSSGVLLYDPMTATLVGGVGALFVFSVEKLLLRRRLPSHSIVARGVIMASTTGLLLVGALGTSTNGIYQWNGQQIRSLLHGPTDLFLAQLIASAVLIIYPAFISTLLTSVIGYTSRRQNEG